MNLCYKLPDKYAEHQIYDSIKQKFEQRSNIGDADVTQTLVVPKKSARCIFAQKGMINHIIID